MARESELTKLLKSREAARVLIQSSRAKTSGRRWREGGLILQDFLASFDDGEGREGGDKSKTKKNNNKKILEQLRKQGFQGGKQGKTERTGYGTSTHGYYHVHVLRPQL